MAARRPSTLAQRSDALSEETTSAIDRSLESQSHRVDERTQAQIDTSDRLRHYILGLLGVAIAVLAVLVAAYRRVQTRERDAVRRIEYMAHYDTVTNLPNRALLADRLAQAQLRGRSESRAISPC